MWVLLPPDGKYAKAAIIYDYLYDNALRTKVEAVRQREIQKVKKGDQGIACKDSMTGVTFIMI